MALANNDSISKSPFVNSIAGIFLFLGFAVSSWFSFFQAYHQVLLLKSRIIVDAEVVGLETRIGKKSNTRYVKYRMSDNRIYSSQVSLKFYNRAYDIYRKRNKGTIKVFTLLENPSVNAVNVSYKVLLKEVVLLLFSIGMCLFALRLAAGDLARFSATVFFICLAAGLCSYSYYNLINSPHSAAYKRNIRLMSYYFNNGYDMNTLPETGSAVKLFTSSSMTPFEICIKKNWAAGISLFLDNRTPVTREQTLLLAVKELEESYCMQVLEKIKLDLDLNKAESEKLVKKMYTESERLGKHSLSGYIKNNIDLKKRLTSE
jgi:hypothetical protein